MARRCVFCDGQPTTKEHGLPVWLDSFLPTTSPVKHTHFNDDQAVSRGERKTVSGLQVRAVCRSCNGGWLSVIESEAIPIIGPMVAGRGTSLDEDAQNKVATWIIKTSLMIGLANPQSEIPVYVLPLCKLLFAERSPLKYVFVSVGAHTLDKWVTIHHVQPLTLVRHRGTESLSIDSYLSTLAVGYFVSQVWYVPNDDVRITLPTTGAVSMRMVWPYENDFIWPPGPFLSSDQVQKLAQTDYEVHPDDPPSSTKPWKLAD